MLTIEMKASKVELSFYPGTLKKLTALLQSGFYEKSPYGQPIGVFLKNLPGFTPSYIAEEIQTIFLNGTPVDDLETPLVTDNSVIALSAAMPGLAGAIFRRNSLHAALRRTPPVSNTQEQHTDTISTKLKLFNSVGKERGPDLFTRGVNVTTLTLSNYLQERPSVFKDIQMIRNDNIPCTREDIFLFLEKKDDILLCASEKT